ncbi:hypothetical protein VW35_00960 [Devosia soli]|uniref:Uncharacterized protein n=1 Tax=Devosia soli TaxID=361041 RepID=A0A0F5LEJ2_9HYPH|nr:hypothetical protein [Devosia soli]KKB80811.1 hypothetical protein VW35_00960 [Devosia soli]
MTDIRVVTYQSTNADAGKEWIAFLTMPNGEYLPVRFQGATEDAASDAALAEWEKHRAEREANLARREEGRRKAAKTRSRKTEVNAAYNSKNREA